MKANEVNLNRFLSQADTQFVIPVYQRNYDWSAAQCGQLVTFRKLEYAVFFSQKLDFRQVSKLYDHVLKTLFEAEPDVFFSPEVSAKLSLTQDPARLRQCSKI